MSWDNDIAGNVLGGGAPLTGTLCLPKLGRWRPIEVDRKARTTTPLVIELPAPIEEPNTRASEVVETPEGGLSVAAMRSLLELLNKKRWDVYSE